ncbi:MAG: biotin transporter BioY [Firmicutes bacterium]|nr:biotin transporter BioY [Bacillota bacterium]
MVLAGMFAALTAVGAFIKIPIPFVPFTLQFFFVLLAGSLLGSRVGMLSQAAYIITGLIGIPVFAYGGGPSYVLQPTFGYLLGYVLTAYLVGRLTEGRPGPVFRHYLRANLLGMLVTYLFGVLYLYGIVNLVLGRPMAFKDALWFGAVLCSPGDILLSVIAARVSVRMVRALPQLQKEAVRVE